MTAKVGLLDEAVAELEDAAAWNEEQRSGLGLTFLAAVDRTIDLMSRWPFTGVLIEDVDPFLEVRRMPVGSFPYYLAYLAAEQNIAVLAVAHERRRPRYWTGRRT